MSKQYQILAGHKGEANELEGRLKTQELNYIKNMFKTNAKIKLKIKNDSKVTPTRIVEGKIIQKNDHLVAIRTSSSVESFAYIEFFTGRARIIG